MTIRVETVKRQVPTTDVSYVSVVISSDGRLLNPVIELDRQMGVVYRQANISSDFEVIQIQYIKETRPNSITWAYSFFLQFARRVLIQGPPGSSNQQVANSIFTFRGPQGVTGLQGPIGPTGTVGPTGPVVTGPAGPTGPGGNLPPLLGATFAVLMENPLGVISWGLLPAGGLLQPFDILTWSKTAPNGSTLTYRRGDTISGITASATYQSGPPDSASVANAFSGSTDPGDIDPGSWTINSPFATASLAGSVLRSGSDLGSDPIMTATLSATGQSTLKTSAFQIRWTRDVYWGVGAAGFNNESQIEALAGTQLSPNRTRTFTVSPATEKVYYSYPKQYGTSTFTLNGFPASFLPVSEVSVTNINGVTSTYYLYESTNLLVGTNLNFVVT